MIAVLAPYDKTGLQEFAFGLAELGFDIYSTSGTQKRLAEAGLPVHAISALTGFPEILDGRVKTLHPMVHAGILARRDKPEHMEELRRSQIQPIDLVCVNLYPFRETVARLAGLPPASAGGEVPQEALENIDIGGPAMIRAAAKNYPFVLALIDPADYDEALDRLRAENVSLGYRRRLAAKAFQHVASYDTAIATYLRIHAAHAEALEAFPQELTIGLEKTQDLRYGENPHQKAALYRDDTPGPATGLLAAERLHGAEMSYLNYFDADAAWRAASEFDDPTVVIVKHGTPCGIASHADIAVAYQRAFDADPISPFGGIIAANRAVTWDMTEAMKGKRYDIIIAPGYEARALERLRKRRDLRILLIEGAAAHARNRRDRPSGLSREAPVFAETLEYRSILGGMLAQEVDSRRADELEMRVVTKRAPTAQELRDLRFAWTCVRHVKSNAIVIAKDGATVGIGGGQPNRLWPTQQAIERAAGQARGGVLASDAFFPFARGDAVEIACRAGITAIIEPGGGVRDEEAVEVCDEYGVAMVFTGTRAFRH